MIKNPEDYVFYNEEAGKKFINLSKDGMIALYIYSSHVLKNGAIEEIVCGQKAYRTVAFSGVSYAPTEFFAKFLCVEVALREDKATVSLNGKSAEINVRTSSGIAFLPIIETALALGLYAKGYCENKLIVIGTSAQLDVIDKDPDIQDAGGYEVLGKYDPYKFTSSDYRAAREKWKSILVGSEEMNDMSDPIIKEKIDSLSRSAENVWKDLNKENDRVILWGNEPPVESDQLSIQYGRIATLAKAWGSYGSSYYKNDELKAVIKDCVQWMYEHMYGEAEIAGTGWRDAHLFNWWYWYIAAPEYLTDIFLIMEEEFTIEERKRYLKCFEWCCTFMRNTLTRDMALSRICICTKTAIVLEDPKMLYEEYIDLDMLLRLGTTEEGPRIDYVQWTHGMPYNTAYGKLNLDRILYAASNLAGTPVEFTNPRQYNQFMVIKYMFEPAMYKSQAFMMFNGRSVHINESVHGTVILTDMLHMIGMFGEDEDAYLKRLIKRNADTAETKERLKLGAKIAHLGIVKSILADESVDGSNTYEYAHSWFTGDRAAQHRNDYAVGIAMSSKREPSYECINSANKTGWHTGDGSVYLYTNYDRHPFDANNFIMKNINIAYRFPGTTEDSRPRVIRSISSRYQAKAANSFAGSMQIDDKYIIAGMDFISHHYDGPDIQPDDYGYGGSLPVQINDLRARKAWFCFDDEIVCLGAGINSTMNSPVRTTLDHRRIVNDVEYSQYISVGGDIKDLGKDAYNKTYENTEWILMEGHAGYLFPSKADTFVSRYSWDEADNQQYFEARIEHGADPVDAEYSYVILPYATKEKLKRYYESPDIEMIDNTSEIQAVREKSLGITGYVFYQSGKCEYISVDEAMIVTVCERDGEYTISVSDPTHYLEKAKVYIDLPLKLKESDSEMSIENYDEKTVITVDFKDSHGRKYEAKFSR